MGLNGPSGELYMCSKKVSGWPPLPNEFESRILSSLDYFAISRIQVLAVTGSYSLEHREVHKSVRHVLSIMDDLCTLYLSRRDNLPFILALTPDQNSQEPVLCPKLKNLILYHKDDLKSFHINTMMIMTAKRASKGVRLRSILVISPEGCVLEETVFKLREYVSHIEYKRVEGGYEDYHPTWDSIPHS